MKLIRLTLGVTIAFAASCQTSDPEPSVHGEIISKPGNIKLIDPPEKISDVETVSPEPVPHIRFSNIMKGTILDKHIEKYAEKSFIVIEDSKELIDFRSEVNSLDSEEILTSLESIDFSTSYVLVILNRYKGKGVFSNTIHMSRTQDFELKQEIAVEADDCSETVKAKLDAVSFEMLQVKDINVKPQADDLNIQVVNETNYCSDDFGNFSVIAEAKKLPFTIERELSKPGHSSEKMTKYRVYRNLWGAWEGYTKNVCPDCRNDSSLKNFSKKKVLISVDLASSVVEGSLTARYNIKLNGIKYVSGYWYLELSREPLCPGERPVNHLLASVLIDDIPGKTVSITNDKLVTPSPFLRIETRKCPISKD